MQVDHIPREVNSDTKMLWHGRIPCCAIEGPWQGTGLPASVAVRTGERVPCCTPTSASWLPRFLLFLYVSASAYFSPVFLLGAVCCVLSGFDGTRGSPPHRREARPQQEQPQPLQQRTKDHGSSGNSEKLHAIHGAQEGEHHHARRRACC